MSRTLRLSDEYVKPYMFNGRHEIKMELLSLAREHWPMVREIYLAGILSGDATFETAAPSWEKWDNTHLSFGRLVACAGTEVKGWAALSAVSTRPAYSGVAEVSVYVASNCRGEGYGRVLLKALVAESEKNGIWTLQASIFPENLASISLHKAGGFREVGRRERIAKLSGVWRNTVLMERRSALIGSD